MSLSVHLSPDIVPVEPGATTPVSVVVANRGPEADRYELELEGLDAEWKAVPVPVFGVDPGDTHTEKFFLKPPRSPESLAGNYPFVVRVRSLISGEQKTVQGMAQVKPFHHLSMEIGPRKGSISLLRKHNTFDVTLMNLGNVDHTVQLSGTDPEDACAYEFETETVALGPGQQKQVEMVVNPSSSPLVSSSRLIGFTVTGRSIDTPSVVSTSQAQLEQRPPLTPATIVLALLLSAIVALWWWTRPQPPTFSLSVDPRAAMVGQTVQVNWAAEHAKSVVIRAGSEVIYEGPELSGNRTVTLSTEGTLTVSGEATYNERRASSTSHVEVSPRPTVPLPVIDEASVDRSQIRLGEAFVLHYKFSGEVQSAVLQPSGITLDPALDEREIQPNRQGKLTYTIVARNSAGDQAERSVTVNVVDESDARILGFSASAKEVPAENATVTISWQVAGADRVELRGGTANGTVVGSLGSQTFDLDGKTAFTITAFDRKGRKIVKSLTVNVLPPVAVDPGLPGTPSGDPATTGTGGTPPPAPTTTGIR